MPIIAKIRVLVEVEADRPFSEKETLANIRKIGTREALTALRKTIKESKAVIRIVDQPIIESFEYRDRR